MSPPVGEALWRFVSEPFVLQSGLPSILKSSCSGFMWYGLAGAASPQARNPGPKVTTFAAFSCRLDLLKGSSHSSRREIRCSLTTHWLFEGLEFKRVISTIHRRGRGESFTELGIVTLSNDATSTNKPILH